MWGAIWRLGGIILLSIALACCGAFAQAADIPITIRWKANTESNLLGYRLYKTFAPGQYTFGNGNQIETVLAGTETIRIFVSDEDAYFLYFVLTAYGTCIDELTGIEFECESGASNEVFLKDDADENNTQDGSNGCFISTTKGG